MPEVEIKKSLAAVFLGLHEKFSENLRAAVASEVILLAETERKARAVNEVSAVLRESATLTKTQQEILCIFDEVFADLIGSIYLASVALDNPARMLLRRSLELGLATVYLWDMPHLYWTWKQHDGDLNFREMVDHISSLPYSTFVAADCPTYTAGPLIDATLANKLYRKLSNIVHGKISDFESNSPTRFVYVHEEWKSHLALTRSIEDLLLGLWKQRFEMVGLSWSSRFIQFES
jgi:hypothetical protein